MADTATISACEIAELVRARVESVSLAISAKDDADAGAESAADGCFCPSCVAAADPVSGGSSIHKGGAARHGACGASRTPSVGSTASAPLCCASNSTAAAESEPIIISRDPNNAHVPKLMWP